jgi:hypothetical protein
MLTRKLCGRCSSKPFTCVWALKGDDAVMDWPLIVVEVNGSGWRRCSEDSRPARGCGAGRIDVEAVVVDRPPGIEAGAQLDAGTESRVDVTSMNSLRYVICPGRGLRDVAVDLTELFADVVEAADRLAPPPGRRESLGVTQYELSDGSPACCRREEGHTSCGSSRH